MAAPLCIDVADEFVDALFGNYIETDGRFVEVKQHGIVEHRSAEVGADPLAERERAHGRRDKFVEFEDAAKLGEIALEKGFGDAVDMAQEIKRINYG